MGCSGCARRAAEFKAKQLALKQAQANNQIPKTPVKSNSISIIAKPPAANTPKPSIPIVPPKIAVIPQVEKIQPQKSRRQLRIEARLLRIAKRQAIVAERQLAAKI